MKPSSRVAYGSLAACLALCCGVVLSPTLGVVATLLLATSGAVACLVGVHAHQPTYRQPWYYLAGACALFAIGSLVRAADAALSGTADPFPSYADPITLAGLGSVVFGTWLLGSSRGANRTRTTTIDAFLVALGIQAVLWLYLMGPYLAEPTQPLTSKMLNTAYSMMDLLLLTAMARLALTPGRRTPAYVLMAAGSIAVVAADVVAIASLISPVDLRIVVTLANLGFACVIPAVLHPSMIRVTGEGSSDAIRVTRRRLAAMGIAVILLPVLMLVEIARGNRILMWVIVPAWFVLSLMVFVRLADLTMSRQRLSDAQGVLLATGQSLVVAESTGQLFQTAVDSAHQLSRHLSDARVSLASGPPDVQVVAASAGIRSHPAIGTAIHPWPSDGSQQWTAGIEILEKAQAPDLYWPEIAPWVTRCPISTTVGNSCVLYLTSGERPDPTLLDGLASLGSSLALALDAAAHAEEVHRQRSQRRFRALVEQSSDMVLVVDKDLVVTFASPAAQRTLMVAGQRRAELSTVLGARDEQALLGLVARAQASPSPIGPIEVECRGRTGQRLLLELMATDLSEDNEVAGIVINAHDTTEQRSLEATLQQQSLHDPLTGLANRFQFRESIAATLAPSGPGGGVLFQVDIDQFARVNDAFGHPLGDKILCLVGQRLGGCCDSPALIARLGGDEFGVLLDGVRDADQIAAIAQRICSTLEEPFVVDGCSVALTVCLGVCALDDVEEPDIALRNGDIAVYSAKRQGSGSIAHYDPSVREEIVEHIQLKTDLLGALGRQEITLNYQPIVALDTGEIVGFEALMRWEHPERGPISPAVFIPLAEASGAIVPLGSWLLEEASRQLLHWQRTMPWTTSLFMAINVSVNELRRPGFLESTTASIRSLDIAPHLLTFEVTESVVIDELDEVKRVLDALKALGVQLAIDDFGTGYSALSYLDQLPFDKLKIDKAFVDRLNDDRDELVSSILQLGQQLGLSVVAEGIELQEQSDQLAALGCEFGQGYLFSRPLDPAGAEQLLAAATRLGTPRPFSFIPPRG